MDLTVWVVTTRTQSGFRRDTSANAGRLGGTDLRTHKGRSAQMPIKKRNATVWESLAAKEMAVLPERLVLEIQ